MNDAQLKAFLAACHYGSFSLAAKSLFISQPVLSRQIAALEAELNTKLFFRQKMV